jgi:2-iminobutanoate/2-iminopropanoate deaminase
LVLPSPLRALTGLVCTCLAVSACSGAGETTVGGRPLLYRNAPSDEVEMKAGIPRKVDTAEAPAPVRPAPAPRREPAPVVAQSQPAPRAGSSAAAADTELAARYPQVSRYGDLLFLSGQIANDLRTGAFESNQDIEAQTRRALENVRTILDANRLTMANIVSVTVYITNISRLSAVDAAYHDFFKGVPPARTVAEVSNLPRGALVEFTVVAGR